MNRRSYRNPPYVQGFSLIEVMVSVVLGMLAILAIFQTVAAWTARSQTSVAGSDAQTSGAIALFRLEREIKQSAWGFGMAPSTDLGCTVQALTDFRLLPIEIVDGASGTPDELHILYGNSPNFSATSIFTTLTAGPPALLSTLQQPAFLAGDNALLVGAGNCAQIAVATSLSSGVNAGLTVSYLKAGATQIATGNLYNLGPAPVRSVWQISGRRGLVVSDTLQNLAANDVADAVIDLQAQYGIDANADGQIADTEWTLTEPTDWRQLRAVRLALLVRSKQFERSGAAAQSWQMTAAPSWQGGSFTMTNVDGSADTNPLDDPNNWRYYRYQVFEKVIPLRNMIWGSAP